MAKKKRSAKPAHPATVDDYLAMQPRWRKELERLRVLALECDLEETIKWRVPCYTFQSQNIALISALKDYCAISFPKGVLLKDPAGRLTAPGKNSRSARFLRFTDIDQIRDSQKTIKSFLLETIQNESSGRKVDWDKDRNLPYPEELQEQLDIDPDLQRAFDALTPGRRRGYLLHFSAAKQSGTRKSRIQKMRDRILAGKGLQDCICGHSKRMPRCDGSHQYH